jgi:protein TonB
VRRSEGVIRGNALDRPVPDYPPLARTAHVEGDVVVEITIGEDGGVANARVLSGHALLQQAALSAAKRWKFKPTLLNNVPVKVSGVLTFRFKL